MNEKYLNRRVLVGGTLAIGGISVLGSKSTLGQEATPVTEQASPEAESRFCGGRAL